MVSPEILSCLQGLSAQLGKEVPEQKISAMKNQEEREDDFPLLGLRHGATNISCA
jgi:hypothetical protein